MSRTPREGTVKYLAHFPTALYARLPVRLPFQQRHVQIAAGAPLALGHVLEPRGHEHEGAFPVGERPDRAGASAYLAVQALDGVVGPDPLPVLARDLVYVSVSV